MTDDDDDLLHYDEFAELAGVKPSTLRGYRAAGRVPDPDSYDAIGRPMWRRSTCAAWKRERPGRGNYPRGS